MLKNYIKVAVRNLLKHRAFSFINVFGLAVAMSICMAIMMLVADQMMYDRHNPNKDRIYRVTSRLVDQKTNVELSNPMATTTLPVRDELLNNYTGVEKAVRIARGFGNNWMELEPSHDVNVPLSGYFVDPEMLEVFDMDLEYGNPATALIEPYSVVLTKRAAQKLFKQENPVGESIKVGKIGTYKVTGVIRDNGKKSHIVVEAFASMSTVSSLEAAGLLGKDLDNWGNFTHGWVYVMLEEGKTPADLNVAFANIHDAHFSNMTDPEAMKVKYDLQPLMDITPGKMYNNPIGPFMPWMIVYFMIALAGIVLVTSCFNFTNLSIARSIGRAREIGVRKATGAARIQIFMQFISESVVIALFSLVLAVGLLMLIKPHMLDLAFARALHWNLEGNYFVYALFVVFAIVVGLLAGLFPAGILSGFQPVKVLKNMNNSKLMSRVGLRKTLLVVQFTFSMIFIITVLVVYNQLDLFMTNDHGFTTKNKLILRIGDANVELLKTELGKQAGITSVSAASHVPAAGIVFGNGFKRSPDDADWTSLHYFSVDENYLDNMSIGLVAGRTFEAGAGNSNKNFILINEKAVEKLGFESPADALGNTLLYQADSTEKQIIGIVKNYNHEMFAAQLEPMALMYNPDEFGLVQVNYTGSYTDAERRVEKAWATVSPGLKSDIRSFEEEMLELYDILFGTLVKVLGFVTFLAITLSCLGLLGMATYSLETRKKEIAVRKVLGSSNRSLVLILSRGYVVILLIAVILAVPAAYFLNTLWLQNFAVHVSVDISTILLSLLLLAFFGGITIGSQTIQAAFVNPVDNLKNE